MDFAQFLKTTRPVLFDGAMATELEKSGVDLGCPGLYNILHPELVYRVHRGYVEAGSQVLATNTFTLNPIYVKTHRQDIDLEQGNRLGVRIAKEAAAGKCYVLGNMTSCGQLRQPYGAYSENDFYLNFKEQAAILASEGVDGFLIQTMYDLKEALCGLRACLDVAPLPVLVSFTFYDTPRGFRTLMGDEAAQCAGEVAEAGGSAVGANCGELELKRYPELVARLREAAPIPVLVQPNGGKPKLEGEKAVYQVPPETFAGVLKECVTAGAGLVGGCCGTGPEHIRAAHRVLLADSS